MIQPSRLDRGRSSTRTTRSESEGQHPINETIRVGFDPNRWRMDRRPRFRHEGVIKTSNLHRPHPDRRLRDHPPSWPTERRRPSDGGREFAGAAPKCAPERSLPIQPVRRKEGMMVVTKRGTYWRRWSRDTRPQLGADFPNGGNTHTGTSQPHRRREMPAGVHTRGGIPRCARNTSRGQGVAHGRDPRWRHQPIHPALVNGESPDLMRMHPARHGGPRGRLNLYSTAMDQIPKLASI
jgi:hypothetical protein